MKTKTGASDSSLSLDVQEFAAQAAVNLIAGLCSKCDFMTYQRGSPKRADEWYLWNMAPNPNQNGTEFKRQLFSRLLKDNKVLVIELAGSLYVAENFVPDSSYVLYPALFRDVTIRTTDGSEYAINKQFSAANTIYVQLNEENIRELLLSLEQQYAALAKLAANKYKRSDGRKGVLHKDRTAAGDETKRAQEDQLIRNGFRSYYNDENGMVQLPRGFDYTELASNSGKSGSEITNLKAITDEAFARVAQAFRIQPALLMGTMADTSKALDQALTTCIDPLVELVQTEINRKRYEQKQYLSGTCMKIDTSCLKHIDVFDVAQSADKLLADGITCIDEIRSLVNMPQLGTWWSGQHWMTKNYSPLEDEKPQEQKQVDPIEETQMEEEPNLESPDETTDPDDDDGTGDNDPDDNADPDDGGDDE